VTPYELLGLGAGATEAQVRRAYRRLARRWHPDLNPGNAEAARHYAAITAAFELLVDPARRRAYDASGAPSSPPAAPAAFAGFDFSLAVQGADASTFGDLFVDVFRQAAGQLDAAAVRGVDLFATLSLTLMDVLRGGTRRLDITRRVACPMCGGHGRLDAPPTPCRPCGGTGQQRLGRGHMVFVRPCEACDGRGVVTLRACHGCHGHGHHPTASSVEVTLPPGIEDGDELVQPGAGHAGVRGGPPGDLRIRVRVAEDPRVRRVGDDLHMTLPVAVHEAVLGVRVAVPSPEGPVTVRVPAGIQSGQRLRLRERGVPSRRTGVRGDLVLDVVLVLPPVIDARARGLMQEFARLHPEDVRAAWYGEPQGAARGDDATVAPEHSPVAGRPTQAE
jgi:molecular chaperone DnaJ